jgi:hypothetical protein
VFRLVRWLFLMTLIAGLAGFVVATRIRGRTPAEGFCSLVKNPECMRLADQGEAVVKAIRRQLGLAPQPRAARREVREAPRASREGTTAPPTNLAAPPLDRHTPGERKALSDLLLERGSR